MKERIEKFRKKKERIVEIERIRMRIDGKNEKYNEGEIDKMKGDCKISLVEDICKKR